MKKVLCLLCLSLLLMVGCSSEEHQESSQNNVKEKEEVTINLNDEVYYISNIQLTDKNCGGFGFPKDVESKIDSSWISTYLDFKAVDLIELSLHSDISWDKEKEEDALKEWNKLVLPSRGISQGKLGYEDHSFYFGYYYIELAKDNGEDLDKDSPYYEFNKEMVKEREDFLKAAHKIIKSRDGYRLLGTCGGPKISGQKLDEQTCEDYNLKCDRW